MGLIYLLKGVDADTNGDPVITNGSAKTFVIDATDLGGGTVALQIKRNVVGADWVTMTHGGSPAEYTANASGYIDTVRRGFVIRATLTGSTTPSNVNVTVNDG